MVLSSLKGAVFVFFLFDLSCSFSSQFNDLLTLFFASYNCIRARNSTPFKGTTEYHKTQDIIHVKQILGHKHTENTMVYINLEAAILQTTDDQFTVRVVEAPDEIKQLLEVGFEFVCEKKQSAFLQKVSLKNTGYLLET